jgi:hypothetical protein
MKMKKPSKVISVESLDEDYEKFQLKINDVYVDMIVSRKEQPNLFTFLMDCFRDNVIFDLMEVDISQ